MAVFVFNDYCCVGNCALKVNTSIFMKHKVDVFPIPTKFFSSLMSYENYIAFNFNEFYEILDSIEANKFDIDCVYIGLVESEGQIKRILKFIEDNHVKKVVFDPILADNGKLYSGTIKNQIKNYKKILKKATLITPNLTEAIILTDYSVEFENITQKDVEKIAVKLNKMGIENVIIKSFIKDEKLKTLYYDGKQFNWFEIDRVDTKICGTGDAFSSLITIGYINEKDLKKSIPKIKDKLKKSIINMKLTDGLNEIDISTL